MNDTTTSHRSWYDPARWSSDLAVATAFLTRLRLTRGSPLVPDEPGTEEAGRVAAAAWCFPLVGLIIGLFTAIIYYIAAGLGLASIVAALFAIGCQIWFTGGYHEDGLARTVNALGGGGSAADMLTAMRQPVLTTAAAVVLAVVIGTRVFTLADLGDVDLVAASIIGACAASRTMMALTLSALRPAREEGIGAEAGRPSGAVLAVAGVIAFVVAWAALGFSGAIVSLIAVVVVGGMVMLIARRAVGGQTGDALGAVQQVAEAVFLAAATLLI